MNFQELNLKKELNWALKKEGYEVPTAIQKAAIPLLLQKKDILGKSHTGTGKTAAFVLPILHHLDEMVKQNQALIICPTRELALQVTNQIKKYGRYLNSRVALLTGGVSINYQFKLLRTSNIVVGTPGRIIDHLKRKTLNLSYIKTLVLDEADEMLKMGFKDDIEMIFANIPPTAQKVFFSATISELIKKIADSYQTNPVMINTNDEKTTNDFTKITQYYCDINRKESKIDTLVNLYQTINPRLSIIFTNTKAESLVVFKALKAINVNCAVINGDKRQKERERTMHAFRLQRVKVLIATDVLARGIDVKDVDYVFNYDVPQYHESYLHRIGRTARAGSKGVAITLVNNYNDVKNFRHIQSKLKIKAIRIFLNDIKKSNGLLSQ